MQKQSVSYEDAIFYMDMVGSVSSPNFKPKVNRIKPYYEILDNRESKKFQRFVKIYSNQKHILSERERNILDDIYGIFGDRKLMKEVASIHNITPERVRQIIYKSEGKITFNLKKG